jgi:DNA polymerase-3 subunit alpha
MRRMLRELRPDRFEHLVAGVALYRPGPIGSGMLRDFIARRHGREPVKSIHPAVDAACAETYGTVVYQETVMAVIRALAHYSLGQADIIRKIMGKKKPEMLAPERVKFLVAVDAAGVCDRATADRAWSVVEAGSMYSFNKSHSVTYALLAYYTAYLKVHHPAQFYASWLSTLCDESDRFRKIAEAVYDLREHGVEVLPPDVNLSGRDFEPVLGGAPKRAQEAPGGAHPLLALLGPGASAPAPPGASQAPLRVRYGLAALRGLSTRAIAGVLAARPFSGMADLLRRAPVTKRDLQALVGSGACDAILGEHTRADALASLDALAKWGARERKSLTAPPKRDRMTSEGVRDAAARDRVPR